MGRGKIEMKKIENRTNRQVTFSKRRQGLLKKAMELSVLCEAQIGLIIFSGSGKLYTFPPDNRVDPIVQKYLHHKGLELPLQDNRDDMFQELARLKEALHVTEQNIRHYLGEDLGLGPLHLDELHRHEQQLEASLNIIRAQKEQLIQQQMGNLRKKEEMLKAENGNMYQWLMDAGQQQQEQLSFLADQPSSSSTVLQLASSSSTAQFYPYRLQPFLP